MDTWVVIHAGWYDGIAGSLRRDIVGLLLTHYTRPHTEFLTVLNPIYDTNEILEEVAGQIGQMRDLAAATAEMQRTLNDTATTAVADFSEGAEKSRLATIYGLWIAGATLLVSAVAVGISIYTMQSQNADAAMREAMAKAQTERLIASEAALSRTVSDLRDELVNAREAAAKQSGKGKAEKSAR